MTRTLAVVLICASALACGSSTTAPSDFTLTLTLSKHVVSVGDTIAATATARSPKSRLTGIDLTQWVGAPPQPGAPELLNGNFPQSPSDSLQVETAYGVQGASGQFITFEASAFGPSPTVPSAQVRDSALIQ